MLFYENVHVNGKNRLESVAQSRGIVKGKIPQLSEISVEGETGGESLLPLHKYFKWIINLLCSLNQ